MLKEVHPICETDGRRRQGGVGRIGDVIPGGPSKRETRHQLHRRGGLVF